MGKAVPAIPEFRARGHQRPAGGPPVPVAFIGRTSTSAMQDPAESLARQYRLAADRLPEGLYLARSYWDVESGGIDLDQRSRTDLWRSFAGAGIPRDGGMAELRAAVASGRPPFAAVICENIARAGRTMLDSLKLESELRAAGVLIFATNEPIDAAAPQASTLLVRRMHQAEAEYFRYNLKTQMWEGLQQYAISGHNTGKAPYGYTEERTPHPNPLKASMGATRARLIPDPATAPWVTRMFRWRADEKLSVPGIARRLTELGVPTPTGRGAWSAGTVAGILANPKYTGRIVLGRTTNTGPTKRKGQRRQLTLPREYWTWADPANAHPALTDMETWEAAQATGRERGNVRDPGTRPAGGRDTRLYPYRARIRCRHCGRRMHGTSYTYRDRTYVYYACPVQQHNPADAATHPGHVRARIRQDAVTAALSQFLDDYALGPGRAAHLARLIPASQATQDHHDHARAQDLTRQAARAEAALNAIAAEIGQLAGKTDPATTAIRDRLTTQFTQRYDQKAKIEAEIKAIQDAAPLPATDTTLIDELPLAPGLLARAPAAIQEQLAAAFDLQATYRHDQRQATVTLTITDATPATVTALLADPRTTHDTHPEPPPVRPAEPATSSNAFGDMTRDAIGAVLPWI